MNESAMPSRNRLQIFSATEKQRNERQELCGTGPLHTSGGNNTGQKQLTVTDDITLATTTPVGFDIEQDWPEGWVLTVTS